MVGGDGGDGVRAMVGVDGFHFMVGGDDDRFFPTRGCNFFGALFDCDVTDFRSVTKREVPSSRFLVIITARANESLTDPKFLRDSPLTTTYSASRTSFIIFSVTFPRSIKYSNTLFFGQLHNQSLRTDVKTKFKRSLYRYTNICFIHI